MRDLLARAAALLLGLAVVGLAALFAWRQNAPDTPAPIADVAPFSPAPITPSDSAAIERGVMLVEALDCRRCHSFGGTGNPRSPLLDVGARRPPEEIRRWIVGDPAVRRSLPRSAQRAKEAYAALTPSDLDALVTYLSTLRGGTAP